MRRLALVILASICFAASAPTQAKAASLPLTGLQVDSHAQFAMLDLVAQGGSGAREAVQIAAAVHDGRLGGIYLSNQGVPAQRALDWGTTWWKLIPNGLDAVVVPPPPSKPGAKPILLLRHSIATNSGKRKAALIDGWRAFSVLDAGLVDRCGGGHLHVRQIAAAKYCLPATPLPSSVQAPMSLFSSDASTQSDWHPHFGSNPTCQRIAKPYRQCVAAIGKQANAPAIQSTRATEGTSTPSPPPLTKEALLDIMQPRLLPNNDTFRTKRAQQIARLEAAVPHINEAFQMFKIDSRKSQAAFLAHYGGEVGGIPSLFRLKEIGADSASYAPFVGRGSVQVTHRKNYVLALAYLEKRARMEADVAAQHYQAAQNLIINMLGSGVTIAKLQQLEARERSKMVALVRWYRLMQTVEAIKRDYKKAERKEHGFRLSAAFWHGARCPGIVKNLGSTASQQNFIGNAAGSRCISGGAISTSGNDRALDKARIYNKAMAVFGASPSQGAQSKSKPKFKFKKPKAKKPKVKKPKVKKKKSGRPKFRLR